MTQPSGLFVGLSTLDLIQRVEHAPAADEKVTALHADLAAGGPAVGAAITFAALGADSADLLTALGTGPIAAVVSDDLRGLGVSVEDAAPSISGPSISAVTVVESTGERSVVSRNAEDVDVATPANLEGLVRRADVVLLDGHHHHLATEAGRLARDQGKPVVLDAGSWKPHLDELLSLTTMAICSAAFRGPDGEPATAALLDRGPTFVAVTDGPRPVRWWTEQGTGTVPVPDVAVRDTLGAGDALHGAFAHGIGAGIAPIEALRYAVAVASLRVSHAGPRRWLADPRLAALGRGD